MFPRIRVPLVLLATVLLPAATSAVPLTYVTTLSGANEVPPNGSPATGFATVVFDSVADLMTVNVVFSGLVGGNASAAHIHAPAGPGSNAGVAVGFPGFPAATSGTYYNSFNLSLSSIYSATFLTANGGTAAGAETALGNALASNLAYVNIHNATFPGGEIRGYLVAVPDAADTAWLLAPAALVLLVTARRRWAGAAKGSRFR